MPAPSFAGIGITAASPQELRLARQYGVRSEGVDLAPDGTTTTCVMYLWRNRIYVTDCTRTLPMPTAATTAQLSLILKLMRRAEFDTQVVTFMHRRLGVPDELQGYSLDSYLSTLSTQQASELINKLTGIAA